MTFRFAGECIQANLSHIIYGDGTAKARCTDTCSGEVLLSIGCTVLIAGLWDNVC